MGAGWLPSMHHRPHDWGWGDGVCICEGGGLYPGGLHPRRSASKGWADFSHLDTTGYGNERAVSILLDSILVLYNYIHEHTLFSPDPKWRLPHPNTIGCSLSVRCNCVLWVLLMTSRPSVTKGPFTPSASAGECDFVILFNDFVNDISYDSGLRPIHT